MLTRQEWHRAAEYEAARYYGKKYAGWYLLRRNAGPIAILLGLGAAGGGAWWLWDTVSGAVSGAPVGSGVPAWSLVVLLLAVVSGAVSVATAIRRAAIPAAMAFILVHGVIVLGILGFIISRF